MSNDIHADRIAILDFGSQYTQLIARRIRECGLYSEILPWQMTAADIRAEGFRGVVLSGGPESVTGAESPVVDQQVFELGLPVLGICYGMQTMAAQLGGEVSRSDVREFGHAEISFQREFAGFESVQAFAPGKSVNVWMSHGDKVSVLPEGFDLVASSGSAPIAFMADQSRQFYGVQFHPEVTHTDGGLALLKAFVREICGCAGLWKLSNIAQTAIEQARQQVGDERVILGLSGGVDSSVVAALLNRAIGDKLTCVFVDNGLLRLGEGDQVMEMFAANMGINVVRVDAEDEFLAGLEGVQDPEAKRKIIGNTFIDIFEREAAKIEGANWLAQGTIYPDVIESAGAKYGSAHVIKSHHNVGGLPDYMKLKLLEPLRELFKDEVRELGVELGLPREMVYRHPFPGPGLGVRILGEIEKTKADVLRRADAIFIEELRNSGWYDKTSQAFAVFLPVKSVGVVGDGRRYAWVIALRAVETIDFMTARWAHLPYDLLERISSRIMNEVEQVSRVVYDVSSKPPATIEWE